MVKFTVDKNKENPYVMLNKTPLSDDRISWRAKGIWAYLLSKPDKWKVRENDLINKSTEGRDAVRGAIKELVEYGYILKTELREKGKYVGVEYSVFESPVEVEKHTGDTSVEPLPEKPSTVEISEVPSSAIPLPEKPSTVKPTTANPPHSNTNVTNKPINNKRTTTSKTSIAMSTVVAPIFKNNTGGDKLPKGITKKLVDKLIAIHGSEIIDRQLKNLKAEQGKRIVKNPAGWLTTAVNEGFDSKVELDLFKIQESKELIERQTTIAVAEAMEPAGAVTDIDFAAFIKNLPFASQFAKC